MPIHLAIGCYHNLLGEALKKLIGFDKEIQVVAVFSTEKELEKIAGTKIEVMLIDLQTFQSLPREFPSFLKTRILLLGDQSFLPFHPQFLEDLITRGVVGILPAGADLSTVKKAVKSVCEGEFWLERKVIGQILSHSAAGRREREKLTRVENEVVSLICDGCNNKEIAQKLKVSEQTVKSHCNRIYRKMGVSNRLHLAIKMGTNRNVSSPAPESPPK
ncbi:MAG: response regulator transcription factor [Syntrophaceae bacterium]|nr:response regulator transcription factor [Syntrophaceae bacterium]